MKNNYTVLLPVPADEPRLNLAWAEPDWPTRGEDNGLRIATSFELSAPLRRAVAEARQSLCNLQRNDGHFADTPQPSARCSAEILLAAHWLGDFDQPLVDRLTHELLDLQLTSGGWSSHDGHSAHAGTSLLAYLALKLSGLTADTESMTAARRFLIGAGGVAAADDWTLRYLALFGQVPYSSCHSRSRHDPGSDDAARAWAKLARRRTVKQFAPRYGIGELLPGRSEHWPRGCPARNVSGMMKWLSRRLDRWKTAVGGRSATADFGSDPASIPHWRAWLWSAFAEHTSGPTASRKANASEFVQLKRRLSESTGSPSALLSGTQPRATAAAITALLSTGMSRRSAPLRQAIAALRNWRPNSSLDAAEVLRALCRWSERNGSSDDDVVPPELLIMRPEASRQAVRDDSEPDHRDSLDERQVEDDRQRLCNWLISRQQCNGSWDNSPYTTAVVLAAATAHGMGVGNRIIDRAVRFLRRTQQSNGSWCDVVPGERCQAEEATDGTPGAIATTARALMALSSTGLAHQDPAIVMAAHWISAHQQPGGGWGERPLNVRGYMAGEGPSRTSDTALAVLGLTSASQGHLEAVSQGIEFLLESELFDAHWQPNNSADSSISVVTLSCVLLALCGWALRGHNGVAAVHEAKTCTLQVAR